MFHINKRNVRMMKTSHRPVRHNGICPLSNRRFNKGMTIGFGTRHSKESKAGRNGPAIERHSFNDARILRHAGQEIA